VCCIAQFMVILDLSIVNVAAVDPDGAQLLLARAPVGRRRVRDHLRGLPDARRPRADRLGHRRVFVTSLLLFALASLAGGLAPDRNVLIVARAIQGLAGAFMAASSLAIVTSSFEPARSCTGQSRSGRR